MEIRYKRLVYLARIDRPRKVKLKNLYLEIWDNGAIQVSDDQGNYSTYPNYLAIEKRGKCPNVIHSELNNKGAQRG